MACVAERHRSRSVCCYIVLLLYLSLGLAHQSGLIGNKTAFDRTVPAIPARQYDSYGNEGTRGQDTSKQQVAGITVLWQLSEWVDSLLPKENIDNASSEATTISRVESIRTWPLEAQGIGPIGLVIAYLKPGAYDKLHITSVIHPGRLSTAWLRHNHAQISLLPLSFHIRTVAILNGTNFRELHENFPRCDANTADDYSGLGSGAGHDRLSSEHDLLWSPTIPKALLPVKEMRHSLERDVQIEWTVKITHRTLAVQRRKGALIPANACLATNNIVDVQKPSLKKRYAFDASGSGSSSGSSSSSSHGALLPTHYMIPNPVLPLTVWAIDQWLTEMPSILQQNIFGHLPQLVRQEFEGLCISYRYCRVPARWRGVVAAGHTAVFNLEEFIRRAENLPPGRWYRVNQALHIAGFPIPIGNFRMTWRSHTPYVLYFSYFQTSAATRTLWAHHRGSTLISMRVSFEVLNIAQPFTSIVPRAHARNAGSVQTRQEAPYDSHGSWTYTLNDDDGEDSVGWGRRTAGTTNVYDRAQLRRLWPHYGGLSDDIYIQWELVAVEEPGEGGDPAVVSLGPHSTYPTTTTFSLGGHQGRRHRPRSPASGSGGSSSAGSMPHADSIIYRPSPRVGHDVDYLQHREIFPFTRWLPGRGSPWDLALPGEVIRPGPREINGCLPGQHCIYLGPQLRGRPGAEGWQAAGSPRDPWDWYTWLNTVRDEHFAAPSGHRQTVYRRTWNLHITGLGSLGLLSIKWVPGRGNMLQVNFSVANGRGLAKTWSQITAGAMLYGLHLRFGIYTTLLPNIPLIPYGIRGAALSQLEYNSAERAWGVLHYQRADRGVAEQFISETMYFHQVDLTALCGGHLTPECTSIFIYWDMIATQIRPDIPRSLGDGASTSNSRARNSRRPPDRAHSSPSSTLNIMNEELETGAVLGK